MRRQIYATRGIDTEPNSIKAFLFDYLVEEDPDLMYEGYTLSELYDRVQALAPTYSFRDINDIMYRDGDDLITAIEKLEGVYGR